MESQQVVDCNNTPPFTPRAFYRRLRPRPRSHGGYASCIRSRCKLYSKTGLPGRLVCYLELQTIIERLHLRVISTKSLRPLALALAKTDMWEEHAGQTQATSIRMQNPFGFHYLSVTVLSGIPGIW